MELEAKGEVRIAKPAAEVFEAIVDPARMSGYFISSGSGRLETGKTVQWTWGDVGAQAPVRPTSPSPPPSRAAFAATLATKRPRPCWRRCPIRP